MAPYSFFLSALADFENLAMARAFKLYVQVAREITQQKCRQTWRPKFIYRRFMGLFRFQNIYRPNRRPYFSLLDLKEKCSKIGHTSLTRFFFLSNAPMTPEGHWYACALGRLEIVWRHKHTNDEKKVLTFLVFPTMKFCESLHASWYRCLLQYIIFWQIFIYFFK